MALSIDSLKPTNKVLKITSHMVFECLKIIKRGGLREISPCAERVQIPPRPFTLNPGHSTQKFPLLRLLSFSEDFVAIVIADIFEACLYEFAYFLFCVGYFCNVFVLFKVD